MGSTHQPEVRRRCETGNPTPASLTTPLDKLRPAETTNTTFTPPPRVVPGGGVAVVRAVSRVLSRRVVPAGEGGPARGRGHFSRRAVADAVPAAARSTRRPIDRMPERSTRPHSAGPAAGDKPQRDPSPKGLHDLARGGVYRAPRVATRAVRSYRTLSPLPDPQSGIAPGSRPSAVCFLWHCPSPRRDGAGGYPPPCPAVLGLSSTRVGSPQPTQRPRARTNVPFPAPHPPRPSIPNTTILHPTPQSSHETPGQRFTSTKRAPAATAFPVPTPIQHRPGKGTITP